MLNAKRVVAAYVILVIATTFSIWKIYDDERALCTESHRRYDALHAVIVTATNISPVVRQRYTAAQLTQLTEYYVDLRTREFETLGPPPAC